ncbi:glycosyltransferase family 1 protein, partial [Bradyrhizobium sp. INPA01-394B]|nr:glycosyltransferase family 1 protein [Bradyrhizobium campsiandrae]
WSSDFIKNLPGCVKHTIAWHAAPLLNVRFSDYDLVVCNFPSVR